MPVRPIPLAVARRIAKDYGYDQVLIYARKVGDAPEGREHMTTYGVNREHCSIAARMGDFLKYRVMGWVHPTARKEENN